MKPRWQHQNQTIAHANAQPRQFDTSDPGTGKTRAHADWFGARRARSGGKALIFAPKTLVESAWLNDFTEYQPDLVTVTATAENQRAGFYVKGADVVITNTDAVKWLMKHKPKELDALLKGFDTLINDESNAFKWNTSQRSKAMAKLAQRFEYRHNLTGTPNPNSVQELWHQVYILDDGRRLGNNFFKFRSSCCDPVQIGPAREHVEWRDKDGIEAVVAHMLRDITIRHEFEKCLDIPPNHTYEVGFTLNKAARKAYDTFAHNALLEAKGKVITAVHAASLRTKLLQIASGAVYDSVGNYVVIDPQRYELIADLVEERQHSLCFFSWRHQKEELAQELGRRHISFAVIDGETPMHYRSKIVSDYQAGAYQTLLLHPDTGAHGLTLTRGTATILCSPVYRADWAKQILHRVYRGGQTQKTETILVHAFDTCEQRVYARREDKKTRMDGFLELVA